jgi:predicted AAA+ superfamily ATPase
MGWDEKSPLVIYILIYKSKIMGGPRQCDKSYGLKSDVNYCFLTVIESIANLFSDDQFS